MINFEYIIVEDMKFDTLPNCSQTSPLQADKMFLDANPIIFLI